MTKCGFGGVLRNILGESLLVYSGSINCFDPNEVETFAMLVGCRELMKLGGHNAIVEGDSFSAIRRGFG